MTTGPTAALMCQGYEEILKGIINNQTKKVEGNKSFNEPCPRAFILPDILAIFAILSTTSSKTPSTLTSLDSAHNFIFESHLDRLFMAEKFPLHLLREMLCVFLPRQEGHHRLLRPTCNYKCADKIASALVHLVVFAVLLPVRCRGQANDADLISVMKNIEYMAISAHECLDNDHAEAFVSSIIMLSTDDLFGHFHTDVREDMSRKTGDFSSKNAPRKALQKFSWPTTKLQSKDVPDPIEFCHGASLTAYSALRILSSLCNSNRRDMIRHSKVFVDRMLSSSRSSIKNGWDISSPREQCGLTDLNCKIVASLIDDPNIEDSSARGLGVSEMMILLQKLLFAPPGPFSPSLGMRGHPYGGRQDNKCSRKIVGLLLSKHLLLSPALASEDKRAAVDWVLRTVLPPPHSFGGGGRNGGKALDPTVGFWGLHVLLSLSLDEAVCVDKNAQQHSFCPLPVPDVFRHIKMMVARTRLIQMESLSPSNVGDTSSVFKCYLDCPQGVLPQNGKRSKRMTFCVSAYLQSLSYASFMPRPVSQYMPATDAAKFLFYLVDTYLRMGRQISKNRWSPDGWLLAIVTLPHALASSIASSGKRVPSSCMAYMLESDDEEKDPLDKFSDKMQDGRLHLTNFLHCDEVGLGLTPENISTLSPMYKRAMVGSLLCHVDASIIAMSMCAAVLKNAFEHHCVMTIDEDTRANDTRAARLQKMIKYQLGKIYDLRWRCTICFDLLELLVVDSRFSSKSGRDKSRKKQRKGNNTIIGASNRTEVSGEGGRENKSTYETDKNNGHSKAERDGSIGSDVRDDCVKVSVDLSLFLISIDLRLTPMI